MSTLSRTAALVSLALLCAFAAPAFAMSRGHEAPLPPPGVQVAGVEVLTRGPIHEAFAEPVIFDPAAGLIVPVAPPAPINESAPEMGPATPGMSWIPGYWAWDQDRNGYIWISGAWRLAPPNCAWVPGYWTPVSNGYQWVAGFWLPGNAQEVTYLPDPPPSQDIGPIGLAPSPDTVWIPGVQVWQGRGYAWRPGYWAAAQANWLWNPAHYAWTPRGYIFIDGYWDYPLSHRGVLFAPAAIEASVTPSAAGRPSILPVPV